MIILPCHRLTTEYCVYNALAKALKEDPIYVFEIKQHISFPLKIFYFCRSIIKTVKLFFYLSFHGLHALRNYKAFSIKIGFTINELSIAISLMGSPSLGNIALSAIYSFFKLFLYSKFISLNKDRIEFIVAGDEAYPDFSILLQLAHLYNIKTCVLKGGGELSFHKFNNQYLSGYPQYSDLIRASLSVSLTDIKEASSILKSRIKGLRSDLFYMNTSQAPPIGESTTINSFHYPVNAIWIFQHDFFDSPGVYGNHNIYTNHFEWLLDTINFLQKNSLPFVVKAHPNNRKRSQRTLEKFIKRFNLGDCLADPDISLQDISSFAPACIATVYGSVIPEAGYCRIPVVTCSYSLYDATSICYRSNSIKQYQQYLLDAFYVGLQPSNPNASSRAFAISKVAMRGFAHFDDISYQDILPSLFSNVFPVLTYPPEYYNRCEYNNYTTKNNSDPLQIYYNSFLVNKYTEIKKALLSHEL